MTAWSLGHLFLSSIFVTLFDCSCSFCPSNVNAVFFCNLLTHTHTCLVLKIQSY